MAKAYEYTCPCASCRDRNATCHINCEKYKGWQKGGIEIKTVYIEHGNKRRRK